jgi:acyl-CoA synthetase (AMP-forming)/AMP-acid ligase II
MIFQSPYPDVELPNTSLTSFVLRRAAEVHSKPALIESESGQALTYGQLGEAIECAARGLAQHGFRPGDVLALYAGNSLQYVVALHAALSLGGCVTTIGPLATAEEVASQLADAGATWLAAGCAQLDRLPTGARGTTLRHLFVLDAESHGEATPIPVRFDSSLEALPWVEIEPLRDVALLPYSSGTTGVAKGVELTHATLVHNLAQAEPLRLVEPDDVMLGVLPLFHAYGQFMLHVALGAGATVVLAARFELESFLRVLETYRVSLAPVVPPIALALARAPLVEQFDLSALHTVLSAAAPLPDAVALACTERLGVQVVQAYGMTETGPAISAFGPHEAPRLGSVGRLLPNTQCRLMDVATGAAVGQGDSGEVWVRGPQLMRGYLHQPAATAATLDADGWLHTGDVARIDEDGHLYIVDRVKELIKYKGHQVAPAELEALLLMHPAVADVAVIPSPDEEAGEVPKACVVLRAEIKEAELLGFVAQRVAPYRRVRRIEIVDSLPRSASGKLLRRLLVERERASHPAAA